MGGGGGDEGREGWLVRAQLTLSLKGVPARAQT